MKLGTIATFTGGALYLVVGILLLTSGSASAHNVGTKKQISIKFGVDTSDPANPILVVKEQDVDNCTDHPDFKGKGCFRLEKDTAGLIKFNFHGQASKDWALKQFTICRDPKITADTEVKIETSCNGELLSVDERLEFFIMDDKKGTTVLATPETGVIPLVGLPGNDLKKFYLVDQNTIKQTYFYNIEACETSNPTNCATLDPPVENTGRN